jgi:hypothetical protein
MISPEDIVTWSESGETMRFSKQMSAVADNAHCVPVNMPLPYVTFTRFVEP